MLPHLLPSLMRALVRLLSAAANPIATLNIDDPVAVVTACDPKSTSSESALRGLTCSSFTSVSLNPPIISFTIRSPSKMAELLRVSPAFAVHLLSKNQIKQSIAFSSPRTQSDFTAFSHHLDDGGTKVPILHGCLSVLICRTEQTAQVGDHEVWFGRVERIVHGLGSSRGGTQRAEPLLYYESSYRNIGDEVFLEAFERTTLSFDEWTHRAHVRMAWLYLHEAGGSVEIALPRVREGIRRYNAANMDRIRTGYNETITQFFVRLTASALATESKSGLAQPGDFLDFLSRHPELDDPRVVQQYYSRELLSSAAARADFVAPDLQPLPIANEPRKEKETQKRRLHRLSDDDDDDDDNKPTAATAAPDTRLPQKRREQRAAMSSGTTQPTPSGSHATAAAAAPCGNGGPPHAHSHGPGQTHAHADAAGAGAEHSLVGAFRDAANSVALLYKESMAQNRRSFESGYTQCLHDLAEYLSARLHAGAHAHHPHARQASHAPLSLADLAAFVEARQTQLHIHTQSQLQQLMLALNVQPQQLSSSLSMPLQSDTLRQRQQHSRGLEQPPLLSHASSHLSDNPSTNNQSNDPDAQLPVSQPLQLGELLDSLPGLAPSLTRIPSHNPAVTLPSAPPPPSTSQSMEPITPAPSQHETKNIGCPDLEPTPAAANASEGGVATAGATSPVTAPSAAFFAPSGSLKRSHMGVLTSHNYMNANGRPGQNVGMVIEPSVFGAHTNADHTAKRLRYIMTD